MSSTTVPRFEQTELDELDYQILWSAWLAGDTITESTWSVPTGLTKGSDDKTATTTTVWLSGGALDTRYRVRNTITTAGGRTKTRSIFLTIVSD
jgi:hypothetical protein